MTKDTEHALDRREVVARILAKREEALLVAGLGSPCWDVAAAGDDARNFYVWGAMGGAAMVGLGLALAQPARRVLVVTGDGEMLMGVGSLATIAVRRPANLSVVVLDNEHYGETGMQTTHTHAGVDLAGMAAAAGFPYTAQVDTDEELQSLIPGLYRNDAPTFAAVKVAARSYATVLPPRDGTHLKNRFREAVLGAKAFE